MSSSELLYSLLHVADEDGKGCRYCDARWYNDKKDKGLIVRAGTRVEHQGLGTGSLPTLTSWHPLDPGAATDAHPCWHVDAERVVREVIEG